MTIALPQRRLSDFAEDFLEGLSRTPKTLPAKYFYDEAGSELFEEICRLPEYYPTRVETALLKAHAAEMARLAGPNAVLVELGAGALRKVEILLDALEAPRAYVPVDISGPFLHDRARQLRQNRPSLLVEPVEADFTAEFFWPASSSAAERIGFFPGSTIGNFTPQEASHFLKRLRPHLSALLIGVDLVKNPAVLHAAYNDSQNITAAFNKNILARANRELETSFDLSAFDHYAFYHPFHQRIEMHLVSRKAQNVFVLGRDIRFHSGESIHTENSYKYTLDGFQTLAMSCGFVPVKSWTDAEQRFSLHWLEAEPKA
ncbi:dimethylhistidine N-methyltransferase [Rhizomicrobium palustre]|uniref:Dimethylhistidine N-methyltransferase n=1 Tax=Rhizomicrobium palustre TaxID=189966 RepID=A0A846MTU2_9PROT|nr:L-histidine N(alpha)-methyltransferase [Rhizomicrobium palustre]NIK86773.1 dimethylhistidine N-methyltransferase [Rhizomicrobium palustre]